ncbi:site-specific integrase [Hyphomicrobium sp. DMF-1]|jgi:integrase/recombinase XerD|uniref:site-specific integrase n=1 Tax=Hyphomicrobium sp. DMF-1 TaxID=3019544 RepID=UPI0022EC0A18|nr:site-specific integrase [Hyphomicrobium sp. DMF-1]WBT37769.1 site-specific integrase [Hyphomicrobium sp. DMF-1]
MPWSTRKPTAIEIAPNWLKPYCEQFLQKLVDQGYTPATMRTYEGAARLLCEAVASRGLRKGELVGRTLSATHAAALKAMHPNKYNQKRFCLERFIDVLVEAGVADRPKPKEKALTRLDRLQAEYESYLCDQRGLTDATIYHCISFLKRFMAFRFGETLGNLDEITPHDVVDFLRKLRGGTAPRDKTGPSHLRNLFRFLFWSGKTKRDLAASIPRARQPAKSTLPRYLKPDEVEKLLDAAWAPTPVGRRNYAMLMVLARLGLRAPEAIAIQLDDIDWRNGTILIRGKGKRHDRMPLPDDVGKAIVDYIKNGRRGRSRTLFVSSTPPNKPFVDAQILNTALKQAFEETGLKPPQKYVGSHLLRHSLATDMLRKGASLDEIGDVLRHRSRMSTTIYARHDVDGLRSIAPPWPNEKRALRAAKDARA